MVLYYYQRMAAAAAMLGPQSVVNAEAAKELGATARDAAGVAARLCVCARPSPKPSLGPCRTWRGDAQRARFRGHRWVPLRLAFALAAPGNADRIRGKTLVPACGLPSCVAPGHQCIVPFAPPRRVTGKKRKAPPVETPPPQQTPDEVYAEAQRLLAEMWTTLRRIDAVTASLPPELLGTEAQLDAEREAMRDPLAVAAARAAGTALPVLPSDYAIVEAGALGLGALGLGAPTALLLQHSKNITAAAPEPL